MNLELIEKKAKDWLKKQVRKNQIVFLKKDIDADIYKFLQIRELVASLNKQYCFAKDELKNDEEAFHSNFWLIIFQFLNQQFDKDWVITGAYAYKLNLDNFSQDSKQISVATKSKTNRSQKLLDDVELLLVYDKDFNNENIEKKSFFDENFQVLKPEYLMLTATEQDYRTYESELVSFIKSSERDEEYIVNFFKANSSPVLMARLIGALRVLDDFSLRIELEDMFELVNISSKIAIKNPFDRKIKLGTIERPAYINRFKLSLQKAWEQLQELDLPRRLNNKVDAKDLSNIVTNDAYHSLTIEGYTVTKALIKYLEDHDDADNEFSQDLRNQLAAKGFMNVISYIKKLISLKYQVNEQLTRKLYEELWKPSLSAKVMKPEDVFRKHMVTIKGAQHVPPNHEKVPYLIEEIFKFTENLDNGLLLGIFLHFFYVGVHPHSDGNGRISRFLMNLAFINDKYKWLTIPNYERKKYFGALEKSQIKDDISYFAEFVIEAYKTDYEL